MTACRSSHTRGFTLIEIVIAMGMLAIGMSGIYALFSASLALQKEATERMDVSLKIGSVLARVQQDVAARLGEGGGGAGALAGIEFPVPGSEAYRYRVSAEPMPDDSSGRAWLCRIVIVARSRGEERTYDMGYRPIVTEPDNDARIRRLLGR